jgi:hypothetical protein
MIKYIVFAFLVIALILNYTIASVAKVLFKRELTEKEVITAKVILYVIMLVGVIYIMCL